MVSGFVDAGHAVGPVAEMPEASHRSVADQKSSDAFESERMREHDIDREAMGEDDDASGHRLVRDRCGERSQNACAEGDRIASEIADRVGDKARPGFAAFGAKRFRGSVADRAAVRLRPLVDRFDRHAEPLGERFGGLARSPERACHDARDPFRFEEPRGRVRLSQTIRVERRIVWRPGVVFVGPAVPDKDEPHVRSGPSPLPLRGFRSRRASSPTRRALAGCLGPASARGGEASKASGRSAAPARDV